MGADFDDVGIRETPAPHLIALAERVEKGAPWLTAEVDEMTRALFGPSWTLRHWGYVDDAVRRNCVNATREIIDRVLPDWIVANLGQSYDRTWWAEMRKSHLTSYDKVALSHLKMPTPARALMSVIFRALASSGRNLADAHSKSSSRPAMPKEEDTNQTRAGERDDA